MIIKFPPREDGQGLVEYALILVLVAIVVIAVLLLLGPQVGRVFSQITYILGNPGAINDNIAIIDSFSVDGTPGAAGCVVQLSTLQVSVTKTGLPVSGAPVQASVALQAGGSINLNGTTNGSGVVQWSGNTIGNDNGTGGGCPGTRTATASVTGGPSATANY
jgi:pilus assembly protein Flp/PilA